MNTTLDWQGHRGSRGHNPENTIPAFLYALDHGASSLEMDVVITGDGQVLISHEHYFSATISTPPKGIQFDKENEKTFNIYKMSFEEISKWDVGLKDHPDFIDQKNMNVRKPLLSEAIDTIEKYIKDNNLSKINYSIEIKSFVETELKYHPKPKEFAKKVMEVVNSKSISHRTIIQSFDERIISEINKLDSQIKCSFLYQKEKADIYKVLDSLTITPEIFGPEHSLVDQDLIDYCHDNDMKIVPWTINDMPTIIKLISMGIDGIITDFPNWIDEFAAYLTGEDITICPVQ